MRRRRFIQLIGTLPVALKVKTQPPGAPTPELQHNDDAVMTLLDGTGPYASGAPLSLLALAFEEVKRE